MTSQPSTSGKKTRVRISKPKKKRKGPKPATSGGAPSPKGNGLTIPEQVAKARKMVRSVETEISKTKQRLTKLEDQLVLARKQLERAENLPRRSALGQALAKAPGPQQQA